MTGSDDKPTVAELPARVFEVFFLELEKAGMAEEIIARLRDVLSTDKNPSEKSLRVAMFGNEVR